MTDTTTVETAAETTEGGVTDQAAETGDTTLLTGGEEQASSEADQTAEGAKEGEGEQTEDDKSKAGAPDQYEDFTFPEGVVVDEEAVGEFKDIARELNLDQAGAQKVADIGAKLAAKWATQAQENFQATLDTWVSEVKADKEIGGDALPQTLAVAKRALATYGTPALQELLNASGFGNNPDVIKFCHKVGMTLKEDAVVTGREGAGPTDVGALLYDNPTSKSI